MATKYKSDYPLKFKNIFPEIDFAWILPVLQCKRNQNSG